MDPTTNMSMEQIDAEHTNHLRRLATMSKLYQDACDNMENARKEIIELQERPGCQSQERIKYLDEYIGYQQIEKSKQAYNIAMIQPDLIYWSKLSIMAQAKNNQDRHENGNVNGNVNGKRKRSFTGLFRKQK